MGKRLLRERLISAFGEKIGQNKKQATSYYLPLNLMPRRVEYRVVNALNSWLLQVNTASSWKCVN